MASDFKTTETKLLAIYKLDFYKKKKNWKLSEHLRKEPSSKIINKLNKAYDVGQELPEPELDVQLGTPHNKAFLQEGPEDGSDPQPPTDELAKLVPHHSWPEQVWGGDKTEMLWEEPQQDWCGAEAEGVREELAYDQCDGPCHEYDLWTTASLMKLLKPSVDPRDLHQDYMATKQILQETGNWLNMHGYVVKQEYADSHDEYEFMSESAEFLRGAHYAPHSTESELNLTQESACTVNNSLYMLSIHQLTRAIRQHHSALTLLLREQQLRETASSRMLENLALPMEEYPQLGIDPFRPVDRIVSGSHRVLSVPGHDMDTGPVYGQLQPHNLIGIRMGRPYRL